MLHIKYKFVFIALLLGLIFANPASAEINVVTTIKPLHSIVSTIMLGAGKPALLMRSAVSPHDYKLKPSDIRALHRADIIFWIGPALESRLSKPIRQIKKSAAIVELLKSKEVKIYGIRGKNNDQHHDKIDPHIWLSLHNALVIAEIAWRKLALLDSKNAKLYSSNFQKYDQTLERLRNKISEDLELAGKTPYIVQHDAFQYFEKENELKNLGSIMASPEHRPGAKRVSTIRKLIKTQSIACVFGEPQYSQKLLRTVTAKSSVRIAILDSVGVNLEPGPDLYLKLMRNLAASFKSCLQD